MNKKILLVGIITAIFIIGMTSASATSVNTNYQPNHMSNHYNYNNQNSYMNSYDNHYQHHHNYDNYTYNNSSCLNNSKNCYVSHNKTHYIGKTITFTVAQVQILKNGDTGYPYYFCKVVTNNGSVLYFTQSEYNAHNGIAVGDKITANVQKGVNNINKTAYNVVNIIK